MAREPLDVWLYGVRIGQLTEPSRFRYRIDFSDDAIDAFGEGARVLSLNIPITRRPVKDGATHPAPVSALLRGLLPEGNVLRAIASSYGIPVTDTLGILRQVGWECAGAVQFLPPGASRRHGTVTPLSRADVDAMVTSLPTYVLPEGMAPQASLAGVQDKILLTRIDDVRWGWPSDGAISTHIVKPEPMPDSNVPDGLIEAEDWALKVARAAGLDAVESEIVDFGGRSAVVVKRYDRTAAGERVHQEDFCQALGLDPDAKYESTHEYETVGGRLQRITALAADRAADPTAFRETLLRLVTFNVLMGNGDAHSKNCSVMIARSGEVSLAPAYDVAPVMYLAGRFTGSGHIIDGTPRIPDITAEKLIAEGTRFGLPPGFARRVVHATISDVRDAVQSVPLPEKVARVRAAMNRTWSATGWARTLRRP